MRTLLIVISMLVAAPAVAAPLDPQALLDSINARRAEMHLTPLRLNPALSLAAADRMQEMLDLQYWAHVSPSGAQPFALVRRRGYAYRAAGENLARGFDTAKVLVDAWMESPGHRANLLNPDFEDVGFDIIEGSTTGRSMGNSVVALFARSIVPMPESKGQ